MTLVAPPLRPLRGHRFLHQLLPAAPTSANDARPLPVSPGTLVSSTTLLDDDTKRATAHMLRIILEVIDGRRPSRQLKKLPLGTLVRAAIETRIRAEIQTTSSRLGRVHFQPVPAPSVASHSRVLGAGSDDAASFPAATAAEFCGTWIQQQRCRAFAGRIEKQRGTWTVTALRFI